MAGALIENHALVIRPRLRNGKEVVGDIMSEDGVLSAV